jgi:molybdopterin-containing oxidoreductase family iron-sulfur binding subunit
VTDENGGRAWLTSRVKLAKTGRHQRLPIVQASDNKRERMLGEALPLATVLGEGHGDDAQGGHHGQADLGPAYANEHSPIVAFDKADDSTEESPYRWGMAIDLDKCTGCSACVAACYLENNIPVVGEEMTLRARQMSWIRVERGVGEGEVEFVDSPERQRRIRPDSEQFGKTDVRHSPMLCQQCGAAPCESVCPVLATYHNPEGLNGMVYNRCVGTRYCSNNCPYKVRRFNYFDYSGNNWPGLMRLMLNPDVTVRGQGVMEKCTFCVQRIEAARQPAKDENRLIRDGEVVTACQQACPSRAIDFGNAKDPASVVTQTADDKRSYHALHVLNTRSAITYLAKVTRGSVEG